MITTDFIPKELPHLVDSLRLLLTGAKKQQFKSLPNYDYILDSDREIKIKIELIQGIFDNKVKSFYQQNYTFDSSKRQIIWDKNIVPDIGTTFVVYYFEYEKNDTSAKDGTINDMNIGSVARSIIEAFAYEMSILYKQMHFIYDSAFIDTANGNALDRLAAMLDVKRRGTNKDDDNTKQEDKKSDYEFIGKVVFKRLTPAIGNISIPQGTRLLNEKQKEFITEETTTIRKGEKMSSVVRVRTTEELKMESEEIKTENYISPINLMPLPVVGVERVEQIERVTLHRIERESDAELRKKCRSKLAGIGKCTQNAIEYELLKAGADEVLVYTPDNSGKENSKIPEINVKPGHIRVFTYSKRQQNYPEVDAKESKEFEDNLQLFFKTKVKAAGVVGGIEWAKLKILQLTITPKYSENFSYCPVEELDIFEKRLQIKLYKVIENYFNNIQLGQTITKPDSDTLDQKNEEKLKAYLLSQDNIIKVNLSSQEFIKDQKKLRNQQYIVKTLSMKPKIEIYKRYRLHIHLTGPATHYTQKSILDEAFLNYFKITKQELTKKIFLIQKEHEDKNRYWEIFKNTLQLYLRSNYMIKKILWHGKDYKLEQADGPIEILQNFHLSLTTELKPKE